MKGVRSLELGKQRPAVRADRRDRRGGRCGAAQAAGDADDRRMWDLFRALDRGWTVEQLHELTKIDPWFLRQFAEIAALRQRRADERARRGSTPAEHAAAEARRLRRSGARAGARRPTKRRSASGASAQGLKPVYKRVDTCAAEFESFTPYLYSTYEPTCESNPNGREQGRHPRQRPEPHRPGHRVRLLLLSRGLRAARRRLRDGDDQLQPGDGVDRLRHRRPAVLPAADVRRRDGGDRDRARRPAARCRASCSSAARRR